MLRNLLCHLVTAVVSLVLLLREGEENRAENVGKVVPGESSQELVESSIHQQDKYGGAGNVLRLAQVGTNIDSKGLSQVSDELVG